MKQCSKKLLWPDLDLNLLGELESELYLGAMLDSVVFTILLLEGTKSKLDICEV